MATPHPTHERHITMTVASHVPREATQEILEGVLDRLRPLGMSIEEAAEAGRLDRVVTETSREHGGTVEELGPDYRINLTGSEVRGWAHATPLEAEELLAHA